MLLSNTDVPFFMSFVFVNKELKRSDFLLKSVRNLLSLITGGMQGILSLFKLWTILDNWVFDNFILADQLLTKALLSLKMCVLANNNSCGKLVLS